MSAPIAPRNERDLYPPLSPRTLSDSASLSPDKRLEQPHLLLYQIWPVDISPETPGDTTILLHCGSYERTHSREHFTPQGAGNKSRSDLISYAKTSSPFLSRISPLPSVEDGMFSGPIFSSLALTWP